MNPLDALRDIHSAPAPGWWPLAPGWWLLLLVLLLLIACLVRYALIAYQKHLYKRFVLEQLADLKARYQAQPARFIAQANFLLKRIVKLRFGSEVAALSGRRWVEFLLRTGTRQPEVFELMADAAYRRDPHSDLGLEVDAAYTALRQWVVDHG